MTILQQSARWSAFKERLRNNYWFIPSIMVIGALILALVSLHVDRDMQFHVKRGWIYQGGADGARSLLSSLAGATLTLAGVVFSMNLVSLTMASQQFGPRLLYNFVRDLGSQFTLGTFTAVFIFCMMVLREVKGEGGVFDESFVPHLSVTVAGSMALCSMGVLIYYVHHVAVHIQAPVIVANVGRDLEQTIRKEFKHRLEPGEDRTDYAALLLEYEQPDFGAQGMPVNSPSSGYVQTVDFPRLMVLAQRFDLVIKLLLRPGEFAIEGTPLLQVVAERDVSTKLQRELTQCFIIGRRRTAAQDIEFAVNELCEVAVRAMSPAINDPFTCIACIDWLTAALEELFQRDCPTAFLSDNDGALRLVWHPVNHSGVMDSAFNQVRHFSMKTPAVMLRLLESYGRIAAQARTSDERESVSRHTEMAMNACRSWPEPNDIADAEVRYRKVRATLATGGEI